MFVERPRNRIAYDLPGRTINLPSYHEMANVGQELVFGIILEEIEKRRDRKRGELAMGSSRRVL